MPTSTPCPKCGEFCNSLPSELEIVKCSHCQILMFYEKVYKYHPSNKSFIATCSNGDVFNGQIDMGGQHEIIYRVFTKEDK
jgi:hypothetical protein